MVSIPIRKRAYYRAVKRGDKWAVDIESKKKSSIFSWLLAFEFRLVDMKEFFEQQKGSFLNLKEKNDSWTGGYITAPFNLNDKEKK